MDEVDSGGVQRLTRERENRLARFLIISAPVHQGALFLRRQTIERITEQRVTEMLHMNAYLMRAARL